MFKFVYHDKQRTRSNATRSNVVIDDFLYEWLNEHPDVYLITGMLDITDKGNDYTKVQFKIHTENSVNEFIDSHKNVTETFSMNEWLAELHNTGTETDLQLFEDCNPEMVIPVDKIYFKLQDRSKRDMTSTTFVESVVNVIFNDNEDPIIKDLVQRGFINDDMFCCN